ncbi:hypothetical protein ACFQ0M_46970 [Kitasatospora aburaviensis]
MGHARTDRHPRPRTPDRARSAVGSAAPVAPEIRIRLRPACAAAPSSDQWVSRCPLAAVTTWTPRRRARTASSAAWRRTAGEEGSAWTSTRAPLRSRLSSSATGGPRRARRQRTARARQAVRGAGPDGAEPQPDAVAVGEFVAPGPQQVGIGPADRAVADSTTATSSGGLGTAVGVMAGRLLLRPCGPSASETVDRPAASRKG